MLSIWSGPKFCRVGKGFSKLAIYHNKDNFRQPFSPSPKMFSTLTLSQTSPVFYVSAA